jgi:predicted acylesterase/phospholipase RssA
MTQSTTTQPPTPDLECDVVMKGGITSGVVYPGALVELSRTYRFRGLGGASAGAIGAAAGAAAELARDHDGFARLGELPGELGDGKLKALFIPTSRTKPVLDLMLAATDHGSHGVGKVTRLLGVVVRGHLVASVLGVIPGLALVVVGVASGGWSGWLLALAGLLVALLGWVAAVGSRLYHELTVDVPGNHFGLCTGLGSGGRQGFTDWLSDQIDAIAHAPDGHPLTFGDLWRGGYDDAAPLPETPVIDLQMMTTCLSQSRPYQLPWATKDFFYDPVVWRTLFPAPVMDALDRADARPPADAPSGDDAPGGTASRAWQDSLAARHEPPLRRLPEAASLPVVVATRMSLSFPLLISAVPLWAVDWRDRASRDTQDAYRASLRAGAAPPPSGLTFAQLWFTDGGLCSNFPLHMFDAALPTRPTFAINLGGFPTGVEPSPDQRHNVELATDNYPLALEINQMPTRGLAAVTGFAAAAVNTARNWQDNAQLGFPGFRDRIVRVLQTPEEGGLNLAMKGPVITGLSKRGEAAGAAMVEQFTQPRYPASHPTATGWDNHRWVRFRALMTVLPAWLTSYQAGRAVLDVDPDDPMSYRYQNKAQRALADHLSTALDQAAQDLQAADARTVDGLTSSPSPRGRLRRIPDV